jgi:prepilin-type N-terminal cleavage/methylation domain-containing protein/prepilin-type processing-associated H-X9-DG protein
MRRDSVIAGRGEGDWDMKKKGFTLIELLVVIAIIALLVSILMPGLSRARELAKRASCGSNTSSVGKAIALYQGSYKDAYPWVKTDGEYDRSCGSDYTTKNEDLVAQDISLTRVLFLLVRDGQSAGIFVCPSADSDKAAENDFGGDDNYTLKDAYDFADPANVSYSYQAPLISGTTKTNGVTGRSNSQVAIMADSIKDCTGSLTVNWANSLSKAQMKAAMSQNHTAGEYINVLYADSHVGNGTRADLGYSKDSIYVATTHEDGYSQTGSLTWSEHIHITDSFLVGPVKD